MSSPHSSQHIIPARLLKPHGAQEAVGASSIDTSGDIDVEVLGLTLLKIRWHLSFLTVLQNIVPTMLVQVLPKRSNVHSGAPRSTVFHL